jgi:tape measure domain-containing protein
MAGKVKVGTAYIDIKLGSFEEFKAAAEKRAKETAKVVADRMSDDIAKKVSGTAAGKKIAEDAAAGVQSTVTKSGVLGKIKGAFNTAMSSVGGEAAKGFVKSVGLGIQSLGVGDLKFFTASMRAAGSFGATALGEGLKSAGRVVGSALTSTLNLAGQAASKLGSTIIDGFKSIPGAVAKASAGLGTFARNLGLTSFMAQNLGYTLTFLATVPLVGIAAAFGKIGFSAALNLEQARASLAPFVGGVANAQQEIEKLSKIAEKSPAFDTTQIIQYAKQLLAAGLSQEKTNKLFQATSNIFTTYGLSIDQANLAFKAITQIMSKGKVQSEELTQQLGEQIPAVKLLADAYGTTQAKILDMVKAGKISADDFVNAMIKIGNTKQFVEGAGTSADTLKSKLANLKEQIQNKLAVAFEKYLFPELNALADKYGQKVIDKMKELAEKWLPKVASGIQYIVDKAQQLNHWWDSLTESQRKLIEQMFAFTAASGPVILLGSKLAGALAGIASIASFLISPIGLVVVAIVGLGVVLYENRKAIEDFFTKTAEGKAILKDVQDKLDSFKNFLKNDVKPVFDDLKDAANSAWEGFKKAKDIQFQSQGQGKGQGGKDVDTRAAVPTPDPKVFKFFSDLRDLFDQLGAIINKSIQPAIDNFNGAMKNLGLATSGTNGKMAAFMGILKLVGAVIGTVIAVQIAIVVGAINLIAGLFRAITSFVTGLWGIIKGVSDLLDDLIHGRWGQLAADAKEIWDGIYKAIVGTIWDLIQAVVSAITGFVQVIYGWFHWLWDKLVGHSIVPDTVNAIVAWFTSLPGRIIGSIISFVGNVVSWFGNLKDRAVASVMDMIGRIGDTIGTLRSRIMARIGDFGGMLVNAGKDLINGFIHGIDSMTETVLGKARSLADKVVNTIKSALQINSPSKRTIPLGIGVGEGMEVGMDSRLKAITDKANTLANAAVPNISTLPRYTAGLSDQSFGTTHGDINVNVNVPAPVTDPAAIAGYTVARLTTALSTKAV